MFGTLLREGSLSVLSILKKDLPGAQVLSLTDDTLTHSSVLRQVRWSKDQYRTRAGRIISKSPSDSGARMFVADFGLNLDERAGAVVNERDEVIGIAFAFPNRTNVAVALETPGLLDLLKPRIVEGAFRVEAMPDGKCKTVARVWLDGPLKGASVRLRRSDNPPSHVQRSMIEEISRDVIAEAFAPDRVVEMSETSNCVVKERFLQAEVQDASGAVVRTLPARVERLVDLPTIRSGRIPTQFSSGDHARDALLFALNRPSFHESVPACAETQTCSRECAKGSTEACAFDARTALRGGQLSKVRSLSEPGCNEGNIVACVMLWLASNPGSPALRKRLTEWCDHGFVRACVALEREALSEVPSDRCRGVECSVISIARALSEGDPTGRTFRPSELRNLMTECGNSSEPRTVIRCAEEFSSWWARPALVGEFRRTEMLRSSCIGGLKSNVRGQLCLQRVLQVVNEDGEPSLDELVESLRVAALAGSSEARSILYEYVLLR